MLGLWGFLLSELSGYVPFSQSKIDLFDEVNHELSKQDLQEAVKLSGYTKIVTIFVENLVSKHVLLMVLVKDLFIIVVE